MVRAIVVLAILAGVSHAGVLQVGDPAAELDVAVDASGKPVRLATYRGRWVVMTIGAAWCGPCGDELPHWDRLAGEYAGRVVFVALDIDEDIADGKKFHAGLGLARMVRVYMPGDRSQVAGRYGASSMPTTFVIGPDGVVRHVQPKFDKARAAAEVAKLRGALDRLVPKPKPPPPKPPVPPTAPAPPTVSPLPPLVIPPAPRTTWWADGWSLAL